LFCLDGNNLLSFDHHPPAPSSTFYTNPFDVAPPQTESPLTMFSTSSSNNNNHSTFYYQPSPQFVPSRPPPSVPVATPFPNPIVQRPLTLKNLSLNPINNEGLTDLLDLGDPGSPPPSPKFDPYG
jgi:hypothetical protein